MSNSISKEKLNVLHYAIMAKLVRLIKKEIVVNGYSLEETKNRLDEIANECDAESSLYSAKELLKT